MIFIIFLRRYDIQKTDTVLVASIKLGLCESEDSSNCLAEFSLLANAVMPLPICKADGTIVWPQGNTSCM